MHTSQNSIRLTGTDFFIPQSSKDAYRVLSGTVLVFIVPWKQDAPGRRLLLCEVPAGKTIPGFVYTDRDYKHWRFLLMAADTAELSCMTNSVTSILLRKFAYHAKLDAFLEEGFHQSIVDFYHRDELKAGVYIDRGRKRAPNVNIASYGVIQKAFEEKTSYIRSSDPLYRAVAFGCHYLSIPIVAYEKLTAAGQNAPDVTDIARASQFACRQILLQPRWYAHDCGVIISMIGDTPVCCVPRGQDRYDIYFGDTDTAQPLTQEIAETVLPAAYSVCRTLPAGKLKTADLLRFGMRSLNRSDLIAIAILSLVTSLIGVLLPTLNQVLYDEYIPLGDQSQLVQLCLVICSFMIGNLLFGIVQNLSESRLGSRVGYDLQNAVYYRVFHLPESFFRKYDSADLAQRLSCAAGLGNAVVEALVITGISTVFSLIYLIRMFQYSAKLAWMGVGMILAYGLIQYLLSIAAMGHAAKIEKDRAEAASRLYQYLNGMDKIRMAGAENQAAYEYLIPFAKVQAGQIRKNRIDAVSVSLGSVISVVFSMVLYYALVNTGVSATIGSFMAFHTAFGTFSGAVLALADQAITLHGLKPAYRRFLPIIQTAQEDDAGSERMDGLSGEVTVDHVTFAYGKDSPNILSDLSLHIHPGEYVGIVGPSGCGKSTLLKLLLGFETPKTGQVCYDGHDLRTLDKRQLRRYLGVVLQNGKLIAGSIFENITITAPWATQADVMAVVEAVGLAEDIARMPMGLHTVLSENSNTISGGQQQRILIARAIISHPSILIFDEATSALDNLTQAAVCESLEAMDVTRIVVAHRLSTIQNCDRILVLKDGGIAEEGNYEELMAKRGLFYLLASRQILD